MFTPVILVCVHDLEDHVSVPHSLLHDVFSPYGQVLRILIFERSATLKALVEYNNINSAILAKKNLNRSFLFNGNCRISIYPSNFQTIRFQNNHYPGGVDYTLADSQYSIPLEKPFPIGLHITPDKNSFSPRSMGSHYDGSSRSFSNGASSPSYSHSHSATEEDIENGEEILKMINRHHEENRTCENEGTCVEPEDKDKDDDNLFQVFKNDYSLGTFQKDFTRPSYGSQNVKKSPQNSSSFSMRAGRLTCIPQSPSQFHNSAKHFSLPPNYLIPRFSEHSNNSPYGSFEEIPRGFDYFEERRPMPSHFVVNKATVPSFSQKENKNQSNLNITAQNKPKENVSSKNTASNKREEEVQCPVLHVLGIENKEVSTKMLHNVFSNFGNIVKLIFIKTRAVALVEFENIASAAFAKEHLNQVDFFGKPLRITYSKYPTIQLQPGQGEKYPDQLIIGDEKSFRFKEGKNVAITPPSCLLHVSNLTKETCKDKKAIANLFGMYGEVQNVKSLFGESGKNMCLVRMKSIEECLKAMAQLHDTDFGGRKLQISFSHSKN